MARETVALARATAVDPVGGPSGRGLRDRRPPDLDLFDPEDRDVGVEARIAGRLRRARRRRARRDPRIANSEGSQVGSDFSRIAYGNSAGFFGAYDSASHSLFAEPLGGGATARCSATTG